MLERERERDEERVWLGFGSRSLVPKTLDVHIISDVTGRFDCLHGFHSGKHSYSCGIHYCLDKAS